MDTLIQDIRVALRSLGRQRVFTAVVIATMALGIGVNTMVFTVVNALLLRPLPFPNPERIEQVEQTELRRGVTDMDVSFQDFLDLRDRARSFEAMGAYVGLNAYPTLGGEPERHRMGMISSGLLPALGVRPFMGRDFTPDEQQPGKNFASVLISHRIWKDRLGADPAVLGKPLRLNGRVRAIVGVMPPGFRYHETSDFWIPLPYDPADERRDERYLAVVARLRPGTDESQARAECNTIAAALEREHPETNRGIGFHLEQIQHRWARDVRPMMAMLMAAVAFVLLIACANVANLMLARGTARQREVAVRLALGAGRARVARQLLTEGALLALAGGALGVLLAQWGVDLVISTIPIELPFFLRFDLDGRVLAFTAGASMVAALLFGMVPALHVSDIRLTESLKDGGAQSSAGGRRTRTRSALVVAEVALAMVLLAGAGLMVRSFLRMQEIRGGFDPRGVFAGGVTLPVATYKDDEARRTFFRELLDRAAELPGVTAVGGTANLPMVRDSWSRDFVPEGRPPADRSGYSRAFFDVVTPGYFAAMSIPLVSGRLFNNADRPTSQPVAIVSRSLAHELWGNRDAVGRRLAFPQRDDSLEWRTIVGVVGDVRPRSNEKRTAMIYVPHDQNSIQTLTLVARTEGPAEALAAPLRTLLRARDSDLPLVEARTLSAALQRSLWEDRIYVSLMATFALLALAIAAVGIYGVMAYSVAQRTQEIGIRMALGAAQSAVMKLVLGQALRLTLLGLGIGLAVAFGATRLMASLLFGVDPSDPPTYVGVTIILSLSAVLASALPALRASQLDPVRALRSE